MSEQPASIGLVVGSPRIAPPSPHVTEAPTGVSPDAAAAADGSAAAKLRAKREQLQNRTHRLRVPPRDVWGDDLWVVVKPVELVNNDPFVSLIYKSTVEVLLRNDDTGKLEPVTDGWVGIGQLMGIMADGVSVGDVIAAVCSTRECLADLADDIVQFVMGRAAATEQALGE